VSDKPVPVMRLARLTRQDLGHVRRALAELAEEYRGRGIALDEIAGGYQFRYRPALSRRSCAAWTQQKPVKLTRAPARGAGHHRLPPAGHAAGDRRRARGGLGLGASRCCSSAR
jgi:hypothetical protein